MTQGLRSFLRGQGPEFADLHEEEQWYAQHVQVVELFVRAYTRGRGFDETSGKPTAELAAVIKTAAARLLTNPTQRHSETERGEHGATIQYAPFRGFNLAELAVLNRYRRRAT